MPTDNTSDRIRLAEAMGWWDIIDRCPGHPVGRRGERLDDGAIPPRGLLPDPFADANDDYAVLEWARYRWPEIQDMDDGSPAFEFFYVGWEYQIGDAARATLTMLDAGY